MSALSWLVFFVLFVVPALGFIAWQICRMQRGRGTEADFVAEADPLVERQATVAEKYAEEGSLSAYHRHPSGMLVAFRLDDGSETELAVPPGIFEDIRVGERGALVTQGDNFIDFGGRNVDKWLEEPAEGR